MFKMEFCSIALWIGVLGVGELAYGADLASFSGTKTQWHSYDRYDFTVDGRPVGVVVPKEIRPDRKSVV